jgi:hypothetical protein
MGNLIPNGASCRYIKRELCVLCRSLLHNGFNFAPNGRDGNFAAAAQHLAFHYYQWQLCVDWHSWTIRVEQVKIVYVHRFAEMRFYLVCRPLGNLAPGIFYAIFAGNRRADDLNDDCLHISSLTSTLFCQCSKVHA